MTLQQIEAALDAGQVEALMAHGRWWRIRRNGRTQVWKTRPGEFRIPIKCGFSTYGELTHRSDFDNEFRVVGG